MWKIWINLNIIIGILFLTVGLLLLCYLIKIIGYDIMFSLNEDESSYSISLDVYENEANSENN